MARNAFKSSNSCRRKSRVELAERDEREEREDESGMPVWHDAAGFIQIEEGGATALIGRNPAWHKFIGQDYVIYNFLRCRPRRQMSLVDLCVCRVVN